VTRVSPRATARVDDARPRASTRASHRPPRARVREHAPSDGDADDPDVSRSRRAREGDESLCCV